MNRERIQQTIYSLNEKVGVHWTNEDKIKFAALVAAAERDHLVAERNVLIAALEQIEITTYDSMTAALARVAIDKVGGARLA